MDDSAKKMDEELVRLGLWAGEERQRHAYILSPSAYRLTSGRVLVLEHIARTVTRAYGGLSRLGDAVTREVPKSNAARALNKLFMDAFRGLPLTVLGDSLLPPILKVDIVCGASGYAVVEVDGYNPRALPYPLLLRHLYRIGIDQHALFWDSAGSVLIPLMYKAFLHSSDSRYAQRKTEKGLTILHADRERFYRPAFEFLACGLGEDLKTVVVGELEATDLPNNVLIFPRLDRNIELRNRLASEYSVGKRIFQFPVRPYLGSKAMLGLVHNLTGDEYVEGMLRQFVGEEILEDTRRIVPRTLNVSRGSREAAEKMLGVSPAVLKAVNRSGMKGVLFSGEPEFERLFQSAVSSKHPQYVLQEEVSQVPEKHPVFRPGGGTEMREWYLRIIIHVDTAYECVADIEVTGRPDKKVHGAPDCIQIPGVLV